MMIFWNLNVPNQWFYILIHSILFIKEEGLGHEWMCHEEMPMQDVGKLFVLQLDAISVYAFG